MDPNAFRFSIRDMTPLTLVEETDGGQDETPVESDFEIVEVTFTVTGLADPGLVYGPIADDTDGMKASGAISESDATKLNVCLYKGHAELILSGSATFTLDSGETSDTATYDSETGTFDITGEAEIVGAFA